MQFLNILGAIGSIIGMGSAIAGGRRAASRESALLEEFLSAMRKKGERTDDLYARASRYSPEIEEVHAASAATKEAQDAVRGALSSLAARFRSGGGQTSGDSEFGVRAAGLAGAMQRNLASVLASIKGNTQAKKMDALTRAISLGEVNPGLLNLAGVYGERARSSNADFLGALNSFLTLAKGLGK